MKSKARGLCLDRTLIGIFVPLYPKVEDVNRTADRVVHQFFSPIMKTIIKRRGAGTIEHQAKLLVAMPTYHIGAPVQIQDAIPPV